jgi:hypothetical protein
MQVLTAAEPLLLKLLEDVRACPDDPLPLMALADYLSEQGPGPVQPEHVPGWLRRDWLKARRRDPPRSGWRGMTAGWAVYMDMGEWLRGQSATHFWDLDHAGSTVVGGLECFASEPYATLDVARQQAACLAAKVKCVGVGLPEGNWKKATVRVLLLPDHANGRG